MTPDLLASLVQALPRAFPEMGRPVSFSGTGWPSWKRHELTVLESRITSSSHNGRDGINSGNAGK